MKSKFFVTMFLVLLLTTWPGRSWAGGIAGNGGGVSEKYIMHAYLNLGKYIRLCLGSSICQLTPWERHLLTEIQDSLPQEYKSPDQIQFRSGEKWRSFFTIDGLIRVAWTGNHVGDPIYVYSDELYSATGKPITLGFAITNLVHEFAHHQGVKDQPDDELDLLGEKVAQAYDRRTLVSQTEFFDTVTATYFEGLHLARELLISNATSLVDETRALTSEAVGDCGANDRSANAPIHNAISVLNPAHPYSYTIFPSALLDPFFEPITFHVTRMDWGTYDYKTSDITPLIIEVYFPNTKPEQIQLTFFVKENPLDKTLSVPKVECTKAPTL